MLINSSNAVTFGKYIDYECNKSVLTNLTHEIRKCNHDYNPLIANPDYFVVNNVKANWYMSPTLGWHCLLTWHL